VSGPDDLVTVAEAAEIIGVVRDRIEVMVRQGLLAVASEVDGEPRFVRAEVEAVREAGG
jgi:predicted site-specific integrase-resolvase